MNILFVNPPYIRHKGAFKGDPFPVKAAAIVHGKKRLLGKKLYGFLKKRVRQVRYGVRAGSRWPWTDSQPIDALHYPFIMAYAVSLLRKNGYEANLFDAIADKVYTYQGFLNIVKDHNPDLVVAECSTPTIDIDLWLAESMSSFTQVALAGPHLVTGETERIQREHPRIKYLLKGEYINSALELVKTKTPGIYESQVVKDLDSLPFPFRDYGAATRYFDPTMPTQRPQLQIYGSKGCPFRCSFCMWPQTMYQGKVSLRSPEKIAQEIRVCRDQYGFKSIFFDDDTFNVGVERISKLCDLLKEINMPWTMMGRLDVSPDWLYDKMRDSGCKGMRFGVETFNGEVLKNINKGLERKDFRKTLEHITTFKDIMIHLTMMKDLPGQTDQIHEEDMKILSDLGYSESNMHRSFQLAACAPFPGTKMYEDLVKEKGQEALSDFSLYDGGQDTVMKDIKS